MCRAKMYARRVQGCCASLTLKNPYKENDFAANFAILIIFVVGISSVPEADMSTALDIQNIVTIPCPEPPLEWNKHGEGNT